MWVTRFRPKHTGKEQEDMEDRWLSVDEMCEYLGMSRDTIYKWIEKKGLPAYRLGRQWKFKAEEIDEWVRKGSNHKTNLNPGTNSH
jgi:excisionase family DNA binding protein